MFKNNVFRDNARYGLDPHTNSSGLTIVGNEAYGNNTHGIIFSKSVNHSVIEGNRSHDNGANGIMLDEKSDFNIIRNNQSWNNRGDGIVVQGSSHTATWWGRGSTPTGADRPKAPRWPIIRAAATGSVSGSSAV